MEISVARKRLEEMRADLNRTVEILTGEHHLVRGGGAEAGDAGANLTEADRNAASVQTAIAQRTEVLAALARIDDGSYGRCVDCAGPVPEPRLEARPATALEEVGIGANATGDGLQVARRDLDARS